MTFKMSNFLERYIVIAKAIGKISHFHIVDILSHQHRRKRRHVVLWIEVRDPLHWCICQEFKKVYVYVLDQQPNVPSRPYI